jgi:hypothetical protein
MDKKTRKRLNKMDKGYDEVNLQNTNCKQRSIDVIFISVVIYSKVSKW